MRLQPEPPGRVRHFSADEETKILAALPSAMRPIMEAAEVSGLRRSAVCRLEKACVDLPGRKLTLTKTKSGRVHTLFMNERLAAILDAAMKAQPEPKEGEQASPYVFLNERGEPYAPDSVSRAFHKAAVKAGVENARFHDTRHTFATRLRSKGVGIDAIQRALDHAHITTSARYAHVEDHVLREAMAALDGPRSNDAAPLPHGTRGEVKKPSKTKSKPALKAVS